MPSQPPSAELLSNDIRLRATAAPAAPSLRPADRWAVGLTLFGLPALLLAAFYLSIGFYFETCDDLSLVMLIKGQYNARPSHNLYLFMTGLSAVLAEMYVRLPGVAWYGWAVTLAAYGGVTLLAQLFYLHSGRRPGLTALLTTAVFLIAFADQVLFFNFTRVPLVVGGLYGALLVLQPDYYRRHLVLLAFNTFVFTLAATIRLESVLLALLLISPFLLLILVRNRQVVLAPRHLVVLALPVLILAGVLALRLLVQPEKTRTYLELNDLKVKIKDYETVKLNPITPADSVLTEAILVWMIGDEQNFTPARVGRISAPQTAASHTATFHNKVRQAMADIPGSYSPVLLLLALGAGWVALRGRRSGRRLSAVLNLTFAAAAVALLYWLKLPLRLASPILTVLLTLNLVLVLTETPWQRLPARWLLALGLVLSATALVRAHKHQLKMQIRRTYDEQSLAFLNHRLAGKTLMRTEWVDQYLVALDPLIDYNLAAVRLVSISGWFTLDPSLPEFFEHLTGQRSWRGTIVHFAHDPNVIWMLPYGLDRLLTNYMQRLHGVTIRFEPIEFPDQPDWPGPPTRYTYFRANLVPTTTGSAVAEPVPDRQ